MTQQIYIEDLGKVIKNKKKLEKELKIKIINKGREIFVEGAAENEYLAIRTLEAIELGFSSKEALLLKDVEVILHILNIKDFTKRKDLREVRARLIGTHGKTKSNIENLSNCIISVHDNFVGIIGEIGYIEETIIALKSLIQGSKQANIYARLEREGKKHRKMPPEIIKDEFKTKENK